MAARACADCGEFVPESMDMPDFVDPEWSDVLRHNGLTTFEELWAAAAEWIEHPNVERGGMSGVSRLELALPVGGSVGVYLKRQTGHVRRTWRHPRRGEPTFLREFKMLIYLRSRNVAAPLPVYFGQRVVDGTPRAVLLTQELAGFCSLDVFAGEHADVGRAVRYPLIRDVARAVGKLHACGVQHRSLYEKHLFVRQFGQGFDVAVIDLEKSRFFRIPLWASTQDLVTFNYRSPDWSRAERLLFFKTYHGCRRLGFWHRLQCLWIQRQSSRKMNRRPDRNSR